MAKRKRTSEDIRRQSRSDRDGMSHDELVSLVAKFWCQGRTVREILQLVQPYGVELTREEPYRLISYAASQGRLRYFAPPHAELRSRIRETYDWLEDVEVVHSASSDDVARVAARMLLGLVRSHRRMSGRRPEFHIGFAGGNLLRKTARAFAELLHQPGDLPDRIVFHAMVAGFNVENPVTDPNVFFTFFSSEHVMEVETRFVALPAPGIVTQQEMKLLRGFRTVQQAYEQVPEIDVIVTAAGHWRDGHSFLYNVYRQESPKSLEQLLALGCLGDLMWRPVGPAGPLEIETERRTMTLMELSQLPDFIAQGKHVVLLIGPCGRCHGPKTDILETILQPRKPRLATHLVVDSRSAAGLFRSEVGAAATVH